MNAYWTGEDVDVYHGDCLDVLKTMADNTIDAIVTDPPYELSFMSKRWDATGVAFNPATWAECLRVLKPGGHLLSFGGDRTHHRMMVAIEDAGFEIRQPIFWLFGSGMPKSLDVSKAIDRENGKHDRDLAPFGAYVRERREAKGWTLRDLDEAMGTNTAASWWEGRKSGVQPPGLAVYRKLKEVLGMSGFYDELIEWLEAEREKTGSKTAGIATPGDTGRYTVGGSRAVEVDITAPATDAAKQWQGWGTGLKPAAEIVCCARKPLTGTVAQCVTTWGTGALNIDGCRIAMGDEYDPTKIQRQQSRVTESSSYGAIAGGLVGTEIPTCNARGRWPANVVLDESQAAALDKMSGVTVSKRSAGRNGTDAAAATFALNRQDDLERGHDDQGGPSRFFKVLPTFRYCAKAPGTERPSQDGVQHATVKPLDLMQYLVRLVTPPGGTVLDPFAGSGTTGEAAIREGFKSILIEQEADYLPLILERFRRPINYIMDFGDEAS